MFHELDIANWPRRSAYEFFRDYDDPFFNFTANLDVTALYRFCKQNELSFAMSALYYSLAAANGIREFRIRLMEGRPFVMVKLPSAANIEPASTESIACTLQ